MNNLSLELKVCEGCGVLWLRHVIDGVYCRICSRQLSSFPPASLKHPGGRPRHSGPVTRRSLKRRCNGGAR